MHSLFITFLTETMVIYEDEHYNSWDILEKGCMQQRIMGQILFLPFEIFAVFQIRPSTSAKQNIN